MNSCLESPIPFSCTRKKQHWVGTVTHVINHGSHYEIHIQSRSSVVFMIGKYVRGRFVSVPDFNAGSDLADYSDYFWNLERLSKSINNVDAITIAQAIKTLYCLGVIN